MTAPEMPQAPKLTSAADCERVRFSPSSVRKSGYVDGEVDAFLDGVTRTLSYYEATVQAMSTDIDALEQELARLHAVPAEPATVAINAVKPPNGATAANVVSEAQQQAEQIAAHARSAAERVVADARGQAAALRKQVEELQRFEEAYRFRLTSYIQSHLDEIAASRPTEPTTGRHAIPKE